MKKSELYTIRNEQGQRLGAFYATSAKQAIQKHTQSQVAYVSTFRSQRVHIGNLTATVEVDG